MRKASQGSGWYIVAVFSALLGMAYFDRYILALLATPISQEFAVSDKQMGLLFGFGFALVYSVAGLPIAYCLDRGNRVRAVVVGVLVWSIATTGCAFAQSYGQLMALRGGVAIGEAVLTPAMVSLIADLFDPPGRARATGTFIAIGSVMSGGAFLVGGFAIKLAELIHGTNAQWPVWRLVFPIVAFPGILLALLLLVTVREPARRPAVQPSDATATADATSLLIHLREHVAFYVPLYLCVGVAITASMGAFAWVPTILTRSYGFDLARSGSTFGAVATPAIVSSTFLWSWLAGRIGFSSAGLIRVMWLASAVMLSGALVALAWNGSTGLILGASLIAGGATCFVPVCALIVQHATPPPMHARLMAIALLAANIVGAGLGPLAPPLLSAIWTDAQLALKNALVAYTIAVGLILIGGLAVCRRGYDTLVQGGP
jgi:MFS family permease